MRNLAGQGRVRASLHSVRLAAHYVPTWIEYQSDESSEPHLTVRVEVDERGPRVVDFALKAIDPDGAGIRQVDLRGIELRSFLEDFVALFVIRMEGEGDERRAALSYDSGADMDAAVRFVGKMRAARGARVITPTFLQQVAKIYRDNIDRHPTQSVQHYFQVSQRTAAGYVQEARRRGYLPPTKRGKKNA